MGELSFADEIVAFTVGRPASEAKYSDPNAILGRPDGSGTKALTLGCGGVVVLSFDNNRLVNGDGDDLYVFEVGDAVEATRVAISEDGDTWVDLGSVEGSTAAIDIDRYVPDGSGPFRLVRLTDARAQCGGRWPGADIDAVAALNTIAPENLAVAIPARAETDTPQADLIAAGPDDAAGSGNPAVIRNLWKSDQALGHAGGRIDMLPVDGSDGAQYWIIEPAGVEDFVRIRAAGRDMHLHVEYGDIELGEVEPDWWSAMWRLRDVEGRDDVVRIQNRWKKSFLHIEYGAVDLGPIGSGQTSAMWRVVPGTGPDAIEKAQPAPPPVLTKAKPEEVRIVQSLLAVEAGYRGGVNGTANQATVAAAAAYLSSANYVIPDDPILGLRNLLDRGGKQRGVFEGSYACQQGPTPVKFTLYDGQAGLAALFEFGVFGDPRYPWGVFSQRPKWHQNRRSLNSEAGEWIARPEGYGMSGIRATLSDDGVDLAGRMTSRTCTYFQTYRITASRPVPLELTAEEKQRRAEEKAKQEKEAARLFAKRKAEYEAILAAREAAMEKEAKARKLREAERARMRAEADRAAKAERARRLAEAMTDIPPQVTRSERVAGEILLNDGFGHLVYVRTQDLTAGNCRASVPLTVRLSSMLTLDYIGHADYGASAFFYAYRTLEWLCARQGAASVKSLTVRYEFKGAHVATATFRDVSTNAILKLQPKDVELHGPIRVFHPEHPDAAYDRAAFSRLGRLKPGQSGQFALFTVGDLRGLADRGDAVAAYHLAKYENAASAPGDGADIGGTWLNDGDISLLLKASDTGSALASYVAARAAFAPYADAWGGRVQVEPLHRVPDTALKDMLVLLAKAKYGGVAMKSSVEETALKEWGIPLAPIIEEVGSRGLDAPRSAFDAHRADRAVFTQGKARNALNAHLVENCKSIVLYESARQGNPLPGLFNTFEGRGNWCVESQGVQGWYNYDVMIRIDELPRYQCSGSDAQKTCDITFRLGCRVETSGDRAARRQGKLVLGGLCRMVEVAQGNVRAEFQYSENAGWRVRAAEFNP